jgi:hypothetical protein
MVNLNDFDDTSLVVDRVYDAVITLADTVPVLPGELFIAWRTRGVGQCSDPVDDAASVRFGEGT